MERSGRGRRKGSGARSGAGAPAGLRVIQALADPSRWRAVELLEPAERSVGDLAQALGLSLPCTSHHVSILKEVGVVTMHRVGKALHCRLATPGTSVGDFIRSVRKVDAPLRYVLNSGGEDQTRHVATYVASPSAPSSASAGAVPEFEPTRR